MKKKKKEALKKIHLSENYKTTHDEFFKDGFSDISMALELMPLIFSKKEMSFYNWRKLQSEKDSFKNKKIADLLFSVPAKDRNRPSPGILILLEHKSHFESRIFEQLLDYQYLMLKAGFQNKNKFQSLIPVVFYHGKQTWKWKLSLQDWIMSQYPSKIPLSLRKNMLDYKMRLIDVKNPQIDRLLKDKKTKSRIFLYLLREVWDLKIKTKGEGDKEILEMIRSLDQGKRGLILSVINYIKRYGGGEVADLINKVEDFAIKTKVLKKGGPMGIEERMMEHWMEKGMAKGIEKGREKGREQNQKQIVLNMLKKGFKLSEISEVTELPKVEILKLKESSDS